MRAIRPSRPIALVLFALLAGCATTPTGRSQLILVDDSAMDRMGATAFDQIKSSGRMANDPAATRYVRCVADALVRVLPTHERQQAWEIIVIQDDTPNAFALPGGKVGVHTGLFKVATNQDQLAAVIGHEMGHMVSRHAAERVSQRYAAEAAMQASASSCWACWALALRQACCCHSRASMKSRRTCWASSTWRWRVSIRKARRRCGKT